MTKLPIHGFTRAKSARDKKNYFKSWHRNVIDKVKKNKSFLGLKHLAIQFFNSMDEFHQFFTKIINLRPNVIYDILKKITYKNYFWYFT